MHRRPGRSAGRCWPDADNVDFVLANRTRIRAKFDDDCPALDFYGGLYLLPDDDLLCADRDSVHSRMGGSCKIQQFRRLQPRLRNSATRRAQRADFLDNYEERAPSATSLIAARSRPRNPLFSPRTPICMTFADLGLSDELLRAIADSGYDTPTPDSEAATIPSVLMGKDLIGIAQTGTGKTAAFVLPMIDILGHGRSRARMPRSLILEPTRELASRCRRISRNTANITSSRWPC